MTPANPDVEATADRPPFDRAAHRGPEARRQPGVGVKEKEHVARGLRSPCIHLHGPTWCRLDHPGAARGDLASRVTASAVDDDDLVDLGIPGRLEAIRDAGRLVERRDDHRDHAGGPEARGILCRDTRRSLGDGFVTRTRRDRGFRLAACASALAVLGAIGPCAGPAPALGSVRPGVIRLSGVLGARSLPGAMIDAFLVLGRKSIPFAVREARRFTPDPEEGVGILMPMGPGAPRIRLIGPKRLLAGIRSAPPGTTVVLVGNLTPAQRLFQVIESSLSPPEETGPGPLNGASAPRG